MLRDLDLSASGYYTCEVSTEHPIFTKTSNEEELTVIIPQRTPPEVTIRKPIYTVGELLEANCSSSPAHPVPHITWLLNGDPVQDSFLRFFPSEQVVQGEHLSSSTVQLTMPVEYNDIGADGRLQLVCVSTIPAFLNARAGPHEYADYKSQEASVEVLLPEISIDAGQSVPRAHASLVVLLVTILGFSHCSGW